MGSARESGDQHLRGPSRSSLSPLGHSDPLPPLRFHAGCWQLGDMLSNNQRRKILGSTSSPPCPQLSSLKNGIDSLHPKTVEKLQCSEEKESRQSQKRDK